MKPMPMNRARVVFLCASLALLMVLLSGAVMGRARNSEPAYGSLKVFSEALHYVQNNYVDRVETGTLMDGAYQGLIGMLDSDSEYLAPGETEQEKDPASKGDIGVTPMRRELSMRVLSVRPGSPAARAGVQPGWYLRFIGDRPARELSAARVTRTLAGPLGSKVRCTFVKPGDPKKIEMELEREAPPAQPIVSSSPLPGISHVRLLRVEDDTLESLRRALKEMPRDQVLLLDLRNNAGGSYDDAVRIANLFLADGILGRLRDRSRERALYEARPRERLWSGEVVLLADRGTAGAAEMIAAALRSRGRARLLGEKTAGVGCFQEVLALPNGGALRLSVAKYQDPNGKAWHGEGLTPDEALERPKTGDKAGEREDPILDKALEILSAGRRKAA
jgi:carboxyl-terminal processing protease